MEVNLKRGSSSWTETKTKIIKSCGDLLVIRGDSADLLLSRFLRRINP